MICSAYVKSVGHEGVSGSISQSVEGDTVGLLTKKLTVEGENRWHKH